MTFEQLKEKARNLPLSPGVYVMRDKEDRVIYVGKAKKLRNRVSQYFQDTLSHTPKTRMMVSKIDHFDVIVAASEFEALVLECSLIKRHLPKYNILLKDGKGYPYLRLNMKSDYPCITMVSKVGNDGAEYFGPYGSRGVTQSVLKSIRSIMKLPECSRQFPRDIGKGRPCLNYHMNLCEGWCRVDKSKEEYRQRIEQARQLLLGNYKQLAETIRKQMCHAADTLNFELAAALRNRLTAVEALGKKQVVTAGNCQNTDVIGYSQTESKACFTVLHFNDGELRDKDYEVFAVPDDAEQAVSSLLKQYYLFREFVPKRVLLPFEIEDVELFKQLLTTEYGMKSEFIVPKRGDNMRLIEMANTNAFEEAERITSKEEKASATLKLLGKMLAISLPERIEAFDISNISGTDIVAGMVVFQDGKPKKSEYKRFKIEGLSNQDDYASMYQVVKRRFIHYKQGDAGFDNAPDLLLIDGGVQHARTAVNALQELKLSFQVFGMVKDDRHRTRALVTPDGDEIRIDGQQSVYSLIGSIQEETHNFAISYHRKLRGKRLKRSELDGIPGIGPKRKQDLLKYFKSISAIRNATIQELEHVVTRDAAAAVYKHFHQNIEE